MASRRAGLVDGRCRGASFRHLRVALATGVLAIGAGGCGSSVIATSGAERTAAVRGSAVQVNLRELLDQLPEHRRARSGLLHVRAQRRTTVPLPTHIWTPVTAQRQHTRARQELPSTIDARDTASSAPDTCPCRQPGSRSGHGVNSGFQRGRFVNPWVWLSSRSGDDGVASLIRLSVSGSAIPSAGRLWASWNRLTAWVVRGP